MAATHAEAAWAAGATGRDMTVAVIDSGADPDEYDLVGRISDQSTDIIAFRNLPKGTDSHATFVSGIIASNFNGFGTVGLAYNSDILSIRVDSNNSCSVECSYSSTNIGLGIDYAIAHGAKVINISLGGAGVFPPSAEAALKRATDAGIVVAIAAGNEALASPDWPAAYATDPRFNGLVIAVGALARDGVNLASFSNKAGAIQNGYLVAPGEEVVTNCTPDGSCWFVSGTSFAAPHVAAAAALLFEGFPNLTGHDVADIILQSAHDLGATGVDSTFGHGSLDIARAFQPLGTLRLPMSGGVQAVGDPAPGSSLSTAFGDGLVGNAALATVGYDDYDRLFRVDLGSAYRRVRRGTLGAPSAPNDQAATELLTSDGARLRLAQQITIRTPYEDGVSEMLRLSAREYASFSYSGDQLRFDLWSGRGGAAPSFEAAPLDAFSRVTQPQMAARVGYKFGAWTLSFDGGMGGSWSPARLAIAPVWQGEQERSGYLRWSASRAKGRASTTFSFGALTERGGPLGSYVPQEVDLAFPSRSAFFSVRREWQLFDGLSLAAEAAGGRTEAQGPILRITDAYSSSWSVSATANCALVRLACTGLSFEVSQPLRIERGYVEAYLADAPLGYFDPLTFSARRGVFSPSGREVDFRFIGWRDVGKYGVVSVQGTVATEPGHLRDAPVDVGVTAGWTRRF